MSKNTEITFAAVASYVENYEVHLPTDSGSVTELTSAAKVVLYGLTGKKTASKQQLDLVKGYLTTIIGLRISGATTDEDADEDADEDFEGSLDELTAIDDAKDAAPAEPEADEGDADTEASETTSEEGEEEETGDKPDHSIVKARYRQEYKARGDARNCGDWLAKMLKGILLGPKKKLDIDALGVVCEHNGGGVKFRENTTPDRRLRFGWQGQARMNTRLVIEQEIARNNFMVLPLELWETSIAKLQRNNAQAEKSNKPGQIVEWRVEVEDNLAYVFPHGMDKGWADATLAKRPAPKPKATKKAAKAAVTE